MKDDRTHRKKITTPLVRNIQPLTSGTASKKHSEKHSDVDCTYTIVVDDHGRRCLQLDTYGSAERDIPGKKSQALRFTPEALAQLQSALDKHFAPAQEEAP